jgi:hypothetical protein
MKFQPRPPSLLVFLLAALLLVGVAAVGYLVLPNVAGHRDPSSAVPTPARPVTLLPTYLPTGWLVYRDPDSGFTFSYPPDAHLEVGSNDLHPFNFIRVVFTNPDQDSLIVDVQANTEKSLPAQFAARAYEETQNQPAPKAMMDAEQSVQMGGALGSKFVVPSTLTDFILYVPWNNKMIVIYPGSNDVPASGQTPGTDLFNEVLGTFVFPAK